MWSASAPSPKAQFKGDLRCGPHLGRLHKGRAWPASGTPVSFSFHATKVFNTIEGGAVAFRRTGWTTG